MLKNDHQCDEIPRIIVKLSELIAEQIGVCLGTLYSRTKIQKLVKMLNERDLEKYQKLFSIPDLKECNENVIVRFKVLSKLVGVEFNSRKRKNINENVKCCDEYEKCKFNLKNLDNTTNNCFGNMIDMFMEGIIDLLVRRTLFMH